MSDTKPVYKFTNNAWVKQDAFQFTNGSWVRISTALAQLATPSISLSGDTLTIENVDNATSYDVYVDGALKTNIPVGGGAIEPITSSVSALNASFQDGQEDTTIMQTTLGGGNGTYNATTNLSDYTAVEVQDNILKVGFNDIKSSSSPLNGKVTVTSGTATLEIPIKISAEACLAEDTLITMADGSHKKIKDIKAGEYCLSLNKNGEKVPAYIYAIDSDIMKFGNHYDKFTFEDGTVLDIIHRHRFYNLVDNSFVHLDVWCEGDEGVNEQGKRVKLVKSQIRYEEKNIRHCTLFCENNTYFANGLLCGNRFSVKPDMGVFLNE